MSLGTIHPNLYKTISEEGKTRTQAQTNLKISLFILSFLVVSSFVVSAALATFAADVFITDSADRINRSGTSNSVTWEINVTNQPGSANTIRMVNITNATGYVITGWNATNNATDPCTRFQLSLNCSGLNILAGGQLRINVTTTQPSVSGERSWTAHVQDSAEVNTPYTLYTAAMDGADLAFDIYDELGNVTNNSIIQLTNGSSVLFAGNSTGTTTTNAANILQDTDSNGLILVESGNVSTQLTDTVQYNVTRKGFVDRNQTTTRSDGTTSTYDPNSGNAGWNNGFRVAGLLYRIRINVTDELGNIIDDATVNVTDLPIVGAEGGMAQQSVTLANHSSGGVYYFALRDSFDNVTFQITRAGFIDNSTINNDTSTTFLANRTARATGNSIYRMLFKLRVNVTDELVSGAVFNTGIGFLINNTNSSANRTSTIGGYPVYYFSIPHTTAFNINVSRSGYVNRSTDNILINSTTQASINPQLLFPLSLTVVDELGAGGVFGDAIIIAVNNTTSTANSTSSNVYYFNYTPGIVNVSTAKAGYINATNNTNVLLNATTQAALTNRLNFSIRVTDICNEIAVGNGQGCYAIDGTDASVQFTSSTVNTTYSGSDAYINASTSVATQSFRINASRSGFVNATRIIITNQSTQARIVFNTTDETASASDRAEPLNFTIKVVAVFDELGQRNFTLNNTASYGLSVWGAGVDMVTQANNVFYAGPSAYVNATGTAAVELAAFLGNSSMTNRTVGVTPDALTQQTVIFNHTDQLSANVDVGGLRYILNVTVGDELTRSTDFDSGVTVYFNNTAVTADKNANSGGGQSYYFTNTSLPSALSTLPNQTYINVTRSGFINVSADNLRINATNGTSSSVTMSFNLKVAVNDELDSAFTASVISFRANNSAVSQPNATSGVFAYFSLPPNNANTGGYFINASRVGYVSNVSSTTAPLQPVNASRQALVNVTLLFTIRVPIRGLCDQLNVTCLTIDGSQRTFGSGGVSASGTGIGLTNATTYSGGIAYINATNETAITLEAFGDGYINRTVTATPNAANQTYVVFNVSNTTVDNVVAFRYVNASPVNFAFRIVSICDEANVTCLNINGSRRQIGSAATEIDGNTSRYVDGRGYIAVRGTGPGSTQLAMRINASAEGYVNVTNTSVTPSISAQVDIIFNTSTTPINFTTRITLNDELGQTTRMGDTAVIIRVNETNSVENRSYFRSSPTSNVYFVNGTIPGVNVSFKRDGYINTTQNEILTNATVQSRLTLQMPYAVLIRTTDHLANLYTGATVQIKDSALNTFTVTDGNATVDTIINTVAGANTSGSIGDTNTSSDGYLYLAINQTNVTNPVQAVVFSNRQGYKDSALVSGQINYSRQMYFLSANVRDTSAPAAATSVTATASGKQVSLTWTASTSSDVSYYRVYRNDTFIGTSTNTTGFVDSPTFGDTTAPGAPSSVTAVALSSGGQINVTWTAPSSSIFVYNVTTVDTSGNLASSNGTSGGASISPAASYRVFRNTTLLLGTTATTAYVDAPSAGVYFYNVTTVSDAVVLSSTNGSSSTVDSRDAVVPAAATSVTATQVGKSASITWTASTSSDVSYYRIYRNDTLLGTTATTAFTDFPTLGNTTAPGAPTSVTTRNSNGTIIVSWVASANASYVYHVNTVDTTGNAASTNGSSSPASFSNVAYYRVYRNDTDFLSTTSATAYTDSPSTGVYYYNVTSISDAGIPSATNGSSGTIDTRDATAPAAATSVVGTINGKQMQVTWTASTASDASYYRIYRNNTILGTSSSTAFTDSPTFGDATAPGAASSVSATQSGTEVQIIWIGPANSIFTYYANTVDTAGNAATTNASVNTSINAAKHYLVYRNNTLLGTTSTTSFKDNPGATGIYNYAVTTVSDANVSASSNGTSSVNTLDTTAPAAAASLTATVSGKQVQLSWLNSSSSDVSYYRIYRNNTFIGTSSNTTGFVDSPIFGDTTAPGAASSVVTLQLNGTITISWTAPANSIFNYSVTTVDTAGNLAAANATLLSGATTLSQVSHYRVFRNDTLVGTSSTTSFTDAPPKGVHIYNVTTVSDAAVLASTNGTATAIDTKDSTAPAAATSVTATVSGKEAQVTWTASTSSDVSYYRIYRNNTLLGTSSSTSFTDSPTFGDTTAPGAPSSVSASRQGTSSEIQIVWVAPANSIFTYYVNTVDTAGNLASTNGSASAVTVSPVSHYRVYRNDTLVGTASSTAASDNPGVVGVYVYNVTTVSDAAVLSSTNGTATAVNLLDATAPAAATSVTATVSGKEAQVTWTASTSIDVSHYRVYRNNTYIGATPNTTAFADRPTFGDSTTPAAPSSVTATVTANNATYREVSISWTAPSNTIFAYNITAVDTSGNLASANGTSGAASISPVAHYRIYRNNTLIGTTSTTLFTDSPTAGIFVYNVTTVSDAAVLSSANGTSGGATIAEIVAPTITLISPAAATNVTTQTPTISFRVEDNAGGVGVDLNSIAVNISGLTPSLDCTTKNDLNYTCTYTASSLTDSANHTISIAARDRFGNAATNVTRNFGVDSRDGITATLNTSDTSAIADNTYANGWSFTFNITLGSTTSNATDVNATALRVANWTRSGGSETIPTTGNTVMNYTISNGTAATYYVSHEYNTTDTIYPLQDGDSGRSIPINGTVRIYVKIPAATLPGTYTTTFTFGSWSVALTGGNPS